MITDLVTDGPAERAGLAKGDIVLDVAGEAIRRASTTRIA
jgi:C-terminal processing protease CtpA/Prc